MIIAVDFDGTIVEHGYPNMGEVLPEAIEAINAFKDAGAYIILWTCRMDDKLNDAVELCKKHNLSLDGINNIPNDDYRPKINAHLFIDDKAFGCPLKVSNNHPNRMIVDWSKVKPHVLRMINEYKSR